MTRQDWIASARKVIRVVTGEVFLNTRITLATRGDVKTLHGIPVLGQHDNRIIVSDLSENWPDDEEEMISDMLEKLANHESLTFEGDGDEQEGSGRSA